MPKPTKNPARLDQVAVMYILPADTLASQTRRAEFVASWWRESEVLERFGIKPDTLTYWRQRRRALAVWHAPENQYFYPPCQFDETGPRREMSAVLGYLNDAAFSGSGWSEIEWLFAPHALLDNQTPADILLLDPSRVLRVLHEEFLEDPETW